MGRLFLSLGSVACAGLLALTAGCTSRAAQTVANRRPAALVAIATASRREIPVQLIKVGFKQGADVAEGDLLFVIDPRPYQDQVDQARATLAKDMAAEQQAEAAAARDRAIARSARADAARYAALFQQGIVSHEQHDQFQSTGDAADAAVRADEANINAAEEAVRLDQAKLTDAQLQLSYTEIHAPISGRTGTLNVQIGNMVKDQDSTPLVVINQISPIYVTFSVPESALPDIRRYSQAGKLRVSAAPPQEGAQPETGVLDFIDNTVDTATGTIKLKGLFQNAGRRLWPGQFLNVTLDLSVDHGAIVAPSSAVQTGQNGKYVFVVDSNLVAHERAVEVGPTVGAETVIRNGLAADERVVTDGQLGVVDGAHVQLVSQGAAAPQALAP